MWCSVHVCIPIIAPYVERGGGHPKELYLRVHVNVVCVSFVSGKEGKV